MTKWLRFYYRFLPLPFQNNSKLFRVWRVREFFLPFYSQITSPLPQTNASEVFLRSHSRANEVSRFKSVKYPSFFSIQPFELTLTQKTISSKLAKVHRIKTLLLSLVLCLHCPSSNRKNYSIVSPSLSLVESFRFEDENEDQVQLLLIMRMLKSVTVMAWQCCCNQLRRPGLVEDEKVRRFRCGENRVLRPRPRFRLRPRI